MASALRIGLATFSLPVLFGFGGTSSRSNPCVLRSDATYLEAYSRISFSDFHTLFALLGRYQENYLFGYMGVAVVQLSRGW